MDKGHRGLLTLVKRRNSLTSFNQSEIRRNIGTKGPNKGLHNAQKQLAKSLGSLANDAPFFLALKPFKHRVAVTDRDGDFTYEELFKRSFYLSLEIKKALRNQESKNQRINLICPNGVSYVIGQWAIWMSGNCCVPLSGQHSTNALEYYIKDSDSVLVITAPSTVDKVGEVCQKIGKPVICQDPNLVAHTNIDIEDAGPFPSLIFDEKLYPKNKPAMMLYLPGDKPQKLLLKHQDLNREMNLVRNFWDLDETSSLLHSMSLYNPFGIVDSLMSPLSAGGRVVLLSQFDTTKVWSHLLGLQCNGTYLPRTDVYAGVPTHYESLIKKYQEVLKEKKMKEFVRESCSKRIKLMVNGVEPINPDLHAQWTHITGHTIKLY